MNKLVVYTCVTGAYDDVSRPSCIPGWADWVAFGVDRPLVWTGKDNAQTSRYPKLNPHLMFPDYEYSLWIDGNIDIIAPDFWEKLELLMDVGTLYAGINHPQRDDVFEESLRILRNGRETPGRLRRIVRFLRREGLPAHSGMNENNIILRRHNDPKVVEFDELWWKMLCTFTNRDQMSWSYCMWKTGLDSEYILPDGFNARNCPWIKYTVHDPEYVKCFFKDAKRAFAVKLYRLWLGL